MLKPIERARTAPDVRHDGLNRLGAQNYLCACVARRAVGEQDVVVRVDCNALRKEIDGFIVILGRKSRVSLGFELLGGHPVVNRSKGETKGTGRCV